MQCALVTGHVQRVTVARLAGREVALLEIRVPGETVHVVVAGGMGVGIVDAVRRAQLRDAMRGATSPTQAPWRAHLEGTRVAVMTEQAMQLVREGQQWRATSRGRDDLALDGEPVDGDQAASRETLAAHGARIVDEVTRAGTATRREALRRALAKAAARIDRRIAAVRGDLMRTQSADALAQRARLFVAEAARAPRGAVELAAVDWSSGEARKVEMPLDPARSAREQIDSLFGRARRLKDGAKIAAARLDEAETSRTRLAAIAAALSDELQDLDALEAAARAAASRDFKLAAGPGGPQRAARARRQPPRPPYRLFESLSGARILVGRGADHNDALTFRLARPHDLWLHAKNRAGAHVVVPLDKGTTCPADLLVEASHLAAHFSEARDEAVVDVQYAPRRHLRKPRRGAPGLVLVDREKVIVLRKQDDLMRRLLEREVDAQEWFGRK